MYIYKGWSEVLRGLGFYTNTPTITLFKKYNSIQKSHLKQQLDKERPILFLGMTEGDTKLRKTLTEKGYSLHPSTEFNTFILDRSMYLPKVDKFLTTQGVKEPTRLYFDSLKDFNADKIGEVFNNKDVVLKVGNLHASENKWKLQYPYKLPNVSRDSLNMSIEIEGYMPDARSIRVGYLGYNPKKKDVFITEQINHSTWLKNNCPDEERTYNLGTLAEANIPYIDTLIELTLAIGHKFQSEILGCDWVVNEKGFMLLELNDIIGYPTSDITFELFSKYVKNLIK